MFTVDRNQPRHYCDTANNRRFFSVHQVIAILKPTDTHGKEAEFEAGRRIGKALHSYSAELFASRDLGTAQPLFPSGVYVPCDARAIKNCIGGINRFLKDHATIRAIAYETIVPDIRRHYAGQIDLVAINRGLRGIEVIDWKTGAPVWTDRIQLVAYMALVHAPRGRLVYLNKQKGGYKVKKHFWEEERAAWVLFLSALNILHWQEFKNPKGRPLCHPPNHKKSLTKRPLPQLGPIR